MGSGRYLLILGAMMVVLFMLSEAAVSGLYRLRGPDRRLDPNDKASLVFFDSSGLSAAAYGRTALRRDGPQVVLIGASNMIKVPAAAVEARLGAPTHNLSISGGEPRDFARLIDLSLEAATPEQRRHMIFVVGVTYASFTDVSADPVRPLDQQLFRFGLYAPRPDGGVAMRAPGPALPLALAAARLPLLEDRLWQAAAQRDADAIRSELEGKAAGGFERIDLDRRANPLAERRAFLAERLAAQAAPLTDERLAALEPVAGRVSRAGARLVVVDLPIPSWHAAGVPAFAEYQRRKGPFLARLTRIPGVYYLDLQQGFPDEGFYDSMHPRPSAADDWARRLAAGLRALPGLGLAATGGGPARTKR